MKCEFKFQDLQNIWSQMKQMWVKFWLAVHFHPLEVVSRYRDSQPQVGENKTNSSGENVTLTARGSTLVVRI